MKGRNTHGAHSVDDGGRTVRLLPIVDPGLLAHQRPQFVQVDGGAVGRVPLQVVVSHAHLTKVPRVAEGTDGADVTLLLLNGSAKVQGWPSSLRWSHPST